MIARVAGHFGEWVQGRLGADGPVALLTVACPDLFIEARRTGSGPVAELQETPLISPTRAREFMQQVRAPGGVYSLSGNIPPGGGAGASTAALVALARVADVAEDELAQTCLAAEGASDPLMLPRSDGVLWASRQGRVLAELPPLPRAQIIGGFWGAPHATDPADQRFADISDLTEALKTSLTLPKLAAIASQSAQRCTDLRGPDGDPTAQLAHDLGALGHLRAHTGSARGLIFAPGTVPAQAKAALIEAGFDRTLTFDTGGAA